MPASLTEAGFRAFLKIRYPRGPQDLLFEKSPFYGVIDKDSDYEGDSYQVNPLITGVNGSNTFATALDNRNASTYLRFNVTLTQSYVLASIDNRVIALSRSNAGAIERSVSRVVDDAFYEFGRACSHQIFRNGGGARGRGNGAWVVASNTIVLADINDAVFYERNNFLVFSSTDGTSGSPRAGRVQVAAVNRSTGTITTVEPDVSLAVPGVANNDFLFREGDFGNSLTGLSAWTPSAAPSATPFYGVDRTVDTDRLAGVRFTGAGPLEEQVIDAEAAGVTAGGRNYDLLVTHPKRVAAIKKSIHGKAWFGEAERSARMSAVRSDGSATRISYPAFVFMGDHGPIRVLADLNCPFGIGYLTERASHKCISAGQAPHFDTQSGDRMLVETSADAKQFRLKAYWQYLNERPVNTVVINWT